MNNDPEPCPCEQESPDDAPGPVGNGETVIRAVSVGEWLAWEDGRPTLMTMAFPDGEIRGRQGKNVSVLRGMTEDQEVVWRLTNLNKNPNWSEDPVRAIAPVCNIRALMDARQRREVCVNADPITDRLGHCRTHASLIRAEPALDKDQRMHWTKLRFELALRFIDIAHCSGKPVRPAST